MTVNPTKFPLEEALLFTAGKSGKIEVKAASANQPGVNISVIICHPHPLFGGTMENKVVTTVFRAFRHMGGNVIRFNYRGVGQSEGEYDEAVGEIEDLISVCDWVKTVRPQDKIWLVGFSFGSFIAASAANRLQASRLITIAPAVEHFNFDSIEYPKCPWLVLQGETDEVVPPALVYQWINKQAVPPKLIKFPETTHFFHGKLTALKDALETECKADFL